jgi:hypothetical protein
VTTATKLNVGAWLAERDRVNRALVRSLSQQPGGWAVIDAVFGDDAPALLMGSAPRLKRGAS